MYTRCRFAGVQRIGIRELRASAAAVVRRAESGQSTVVTVGGRPVARVVPLTGGGGGGAGERSLDDLVAQGLVIAPRRRGDVRDTFIPVWGTIRLDRLLREVRG